MKYFLLFQVPIKPALKRCASDITKMASTKTVLTLVLINLVVIKCDNDVRAHNYAMDDLRADLLRGSIDREEFRHKDIEPEKSMIFDDNETDVETNDRISEDRLTTVDYTTTEVPDEKDSEEEIVPTEQIDTGETDNAVYRTRLAGEDIYLGETQHGKEAKVSIVCFDDLFNGKLIV